MKQNNKVEEVTLSDVRAYYIPTVIKTVGIDRETYRSLEYMEPRNKTHTNIP